MPAKKWGKYKCSLNKVGEIYGGPAKKSGLTNAPEAKALEAQKAQRTVLSAPLCDDLITDLLGRSPRFRHRT